MRYIYTGQSILMPLVSKPQLPPNMFSLVAFALVAAASAYVPLDTPEVAAAKAAHLAEVQRAAVAAGASPYYPYLGYSSYATPVVTPEGFIADTPEVAAAKSAHFAEKAKAAAVSAPAYPYAYAAYPHYSAYPYAAYPYAAPVVTPSGFLADTPEVAAAKAAHFAEVAKAQAIA